MNSWYKIIKELMMSIHTLIHDHEIMAEVIYLKSIQIQLQIDYVSSKNACFSAGN